MEIKDWLWVRLVLYGCAFVVAVATPAPREALPLAAGPQVHHVAVMAFSPFVLAFAISLMSLDPRSDEEWSRPTHHSNPFNFFSPLNGLHFMSFVLFAVGLGLVAGSLNGRSKFSYGLEAILMGCSTWLGGRLGARLCKHKMRDSDRP